MKTLTNKEKDFLTRNRRVIEPLLTARIEAYKDDILIEEDEKKRDSLIRWVREYQMGLKLLDVVEKEDEKPFTGI